MVYRLYTTYSGNGRYLVGVSESDCQRIISAARTTPRPPGGFTDVPCGPVSMVIWDTATSSIHCYIHPQLVPDFTFVRIGERLWSRILPLATGIEPEAAVSLSALGLLYLEGELPDGTPVDVYLGGLPTPLEPPETEYPPDLDDIPDNISNDFPE